jgi:hypothetical protein
MANRASSILATIANGASDSSVINVASGVVVGIEFPATMTGTTVILKSSETQAGTFISHVVSGGTSLSIPFVASSVVQINANDVTAIRQWIKISSNATEGASRSLKLIIRDIA